MQAAHITGGTQNYNSKEDCMGRVFIWGHAEGHNFYLGAGEYQKFENRESQHKLQIFCGTQLVEKYYISLLHWTQLNRITDNGINCLMESDLSRFTSPKYLSYLTKVKLICLIVSFS
jgi:hypothetical protein